jgi:ComF family protein
VVTILLDLIYPKTCGMCGKTYSTYLCPKCNLKLKSLLNKKQLHYPKEKYFDELIYIFKYENEIRQKIIDYKFNKKAYLYKFFSQLIIYNYFNSINTYDIILPVPINKKGLLLRGYNQASLISKEIAKKIYNLEFSNKVLIKQRETLKQSTLKKTEREQNVKNAFAVINYNKIKGKSIILFDDIYTTGSTTNECSRILKEAGAKKILVFTIDKD